MSKKFAQNTIEFKQDEIEKLIIDTFKNLDTKFKDANRQLGEQTTKELNTIVTNLSKEVETKINEIKSLVPVLPGRQPGGTAPVQQAADDKIKDKLKGGEADNIPEDKVNKKQLDMGQKVEMEHTDDPEIAREIARDHLAEELKEGKDKEDQEYYTNLRKMHKDSIHDLPGVVKESKKKKKKDKKKSKHSLEPMPDHPTPRDGEHNKDLPDFWRRNFDYGESPYMNIGFIEKITDKPPIKKKKKKSEMIADLVSLADHMDEAGLTDEADRIDKLIDLERRKRNHHKGYKCKKVKGNE
jgi:hypothetical protein